MMLPEIKERRLHFTSNVTMDSVSALSKSIIDINASDEYNTKIFAANKLTYVPEPITIYIDSYGGLVYQCLGLLGIIENSKVPIHTIVTGCAMSCGFLISIAGHWRSAYKNSTFMYHQISNVSFGKIGEINEDTIEANRLQKIIEKHTLNYTKITPAQLKENYEKKQDWYMDARQALKYGVINNII
jgi:ATP-dependent Clp protease, protease subunit